MKLLCVVFAIVVQVQRSDWCSYLFREVARSATERGEFASVPRNSGHSEEAISGENIFLSIGLI